MKMKLKVDPLNCLYTIGIIGSLFVSMNDHNDDILYIPFYFMFEVNMIGNYCLCYLEFMVY